MSATFVNNQDFINLSVEINRNRSSSNRDFQITIFSFKQSVFFCFSICFFFRTGRTSTLIFCRKNLRPRCTRSSRREFLVRLWIDWLHVFRERSMWNQDRLKKAVSHVSMADVAPLGQSHILMYPSYMYRLGK